MDRLSDDELFLILRRIRGRVDRKSCAQVCRRWLLAEGRTRTELRILDPSLLTSFLHRFPRLLSIEAGSGLSDAHLSFISRSCPSLQTLNFGISKSRDLVDLNFTEDYEKYEGIGDDGISAIAAACKNLQRVNLRWRINVGDRGISSLVRGCLSLSHLDLSGCERITNLALAAISNANCLETLILDGCKMVNNVGIHFLAQGKTSSTLKTLDLCECCRITDEGIGLLPQMVALRDLSLAKCGATITDKGVASLASSKNLQSLNLSWLPNVSDLSILAIRSGCSDLKELVLSGCDQITGTSLQGFASVQAITLSACPNILREDVEAIVNSCHILKYLGLDKDLRRYIPLSCLKIIESKCTIEWL
jgi:F-box/leucine-rich repeat protein 2/20